MQQCSTCGKSFKNLAQHITKMHNISTIYFDNSENAFLVMNDVVHEGVEPFLHDAGEREIEFYPDGEFGVQTITLRIKKNKKQVYSYEWCKSKHDHIRKYIHNIKVSSESYNPFN